MKTINDQNSGVYQKNFELIDSTLPLQGFPETPLAEQLQAFANLANYLPAQQIIKLLDSRWIILLSNHASDQLRVEFNFWIGTVLHAWKVVLVSQQNLCGRMATHIPAILVNDPTMYDNSPIWVHDPTLNYGTCISMFKSPASICLHSRYPPNKQAYPRLG